MKCSDYFCREVSLPSIFLSCSGAFSEGMLENTRVRQAKLADHTCRIPKNRLGLSDGMMTHKWQCYLEMPQQLSMMPDCGNICLTLVLVLITKE